MSVQDIEARLKVLEDIEEIKRLKARYCAYCDAQDADGVAGLFAEDAVFEGVMLGARSEGREAIRTRFVGAPRTVSFAVHMVLNPLISVDGDTATGIWYLFQPYTLVDGDQAMWGSGRYDEEYVRTNGEWKIKSVKIVSFFWTPFDQGWALKRFA